MLLDGVSLHKFPFDLPGILRQWTAFMHNLKKNQNGPTQASVLCSAHFMEDFYLAKYRLMESVGTPVKRKEFERDFFPTIQTERPHGGNTLYWKNVGLNTFPLQS